MVEQGYGQDDVNLVMSDETRKKHFAADGRETELGSKALEGAGTGAAIGGAVGATLAAIAAIEQPWLYQDSDYSLLVQSQQDWPEPERVARQVD